MIFANVNDIAIPEGNVIKIHETNGGRVLWEKKKSDEYSFSVKVFNSVGSHERSFSLKVS